MKIVIDLKEPNYQPNYDSLFDYIESEAGQEFLRKAERGNYSFRSMMQTLVLNDALPINSSKRVWHSVRMMYTKTKPLSVLSYE